MIRPTTPGANKTEGYIGRTHHESQPWFETRPKAPAASPNVVYVILDDVGYADLGCYGSEISTPNFDRLAARGVRYSNFHTTTLCSASRACMLTGRNHHSVGMRYLANVDMGWPNGRGEISPQAALISEVLRDAGYSTFAVGKWHIAPTDQASAAGPFDQWPLGRGFERFYGFMNGSSDHYHPELIADNHPIRAPLAPAGDYHLSQDLIHQAIDMLTNQVSITPGKPFFMNLAFGAGHFPHQAPKPFIDAYDGIYETGWDNIRAARLQRQIYMGLVPKDTVLPPSNPGVRPWSDLSPDEKRVAVRLQKAYAGFMTYTDQQFGKLLDFLERVGKLDNTLIVLMSDNGASIDCGPNGTNNVLRFFNQLEDSTERTLAELDLIGTERSYSNYPWGWAQASNTPLRLYKSFVHGGGVRDPMVVSWPQHLTSHGDIRHQFVHAVDVVPTVLEACGVLPPQTVRGVPQMPIHGTSFGYTFGDPLAPCRKEVQYFEMYGHRSLWHRGWKAVTNHVPGQSFEADEWELYHLDEDFAECNNLAQQQPEKLREMVERWWAEAGKYDVMPLDDRREVLFKAKPRPDSVRAGRHFVYYQGIAPIPAQAAPLTPDVSHRIVATVHCATPADGVLVSFGNASGGYALMVKNRRLTYVYNCCGDVTRLVAAEEIEAGAKSLCFEFQKTGVLKGMGRLYVDGRQVGEALFNQTLQRISLVPLCVGHSWLPPVSDDYTGEFPFNGTIETLRFELSEDRDLPEPEAHVD